MKHVNLDFVIEGDVLARDVVISNEYLFGAGTVLNKQRIEILKELDVKSVLIENRERSQDSVAEVFDCIDKRFSYVEDIPVMEQIKSWMKDIIENIETHSEKNNEKSN